MNDMLNYTAALIAGLLLGTFFFGGLWWTVRRAVASPQPALWLLGSLLLRTAVVLIGIYAVGSGQWQRLMLCLLGFFIARIIVIRLTRPMAGSSRLATPEARHAP
jgi:F1F0 ATPase subunit 2